MKNKATVSDKFQQRINQSLARSQYPSDQLAERCRTLVSKYLDVIVDNAKSNVSNRQLKSYIETYRTMYDDLQYQLDISRRNTTNLSLAVIVLCSMLIFAVVIL